MLRKAEIMTNEVRMFWRTCQSLNSEDPQIVEEAIDELDVLRMHTDSPLLKEQCSRMIDHVAARVADSVGRRAQG